MTVPDSHGATQLAEALASITAAARTLIPGVDHASISLCHPDGSLETAAPTDPITVLANQFQHELREGPCYAAGSDERVCYAPDLASEARWPTYGPKAAALGLHAQLAIRLSTERGTSAGLNLYATEPGALDESLHLAVGVADLASTTFKHARACATLAEAMETRGVIGAAVGVTMERYAVDADRAFDHLVRESQTSNTKLRVVARSIVTSRGRSAEALESLG